jgi:hypothetical protein
MKSEILLRCSSVTLDEVTLTRIRNLITRVEQLKYDKTTVDKYQIQQLLICCQ